MHDLRNICFAPDGVVGASGTGTVAPPAAADPGAALLSQAPAGGAPAAPAAPAAPSGDPWYKEIPAEFQTSLTAKGWDKLPALEAPKVLSDAYFNLEKLLGADRAGRTVVLPKEDASPEEKRAFAAKLGAPEKPEGYEIKAPDGAPQELVKDAQKWMHDLGLPKAQGEQLAQKYLEAEAANFKAFQAEGAKAIDTLKVEWGADYDKNTEAGRRAVRSLGLDADAITRIERSLGTAQMVKLFAKIGGNVLEDGGPSNTSSTNANFVLTQQAAQSKIEALKGDTAFQAKLNSPNGNVRNLALAEWEDAHKAASSAG